ncbi:MAG: ADP-ribosylglycohydrolase family protein [Clostridia bacterium]|nr:ADP-ribosylglycohydrolase family protein [Clostridia bacterium]
MNTAILYDKIYACWLGKNIGGTLGTPVEGRMEIMDLTWYPRLDPRGALPNDDLDLQLLNLHAMETYGVRTKAEHIAAEWSEHCYFPWDEYGHAGTAMRYGFKPPFSGMFDNHFTNCMGCPIRSEVWAAIAAGKPRLAAYFAWQDAVVDHAGGEGVFGEIFNAALEAAAYLSSDVPALIREALTYIPETSRVFGAVSLMLSLYEKGTDLLEARAQVLEQFGDPNFTDAPQNIAFGLAGLLWGENFEDAILKVVNLGYDTDCTVATCGAIWGILYGRDGIDPKWSEPIGDAIQVSAAIRGFRAPADLDELTHRCIKLYDKLCCEDESDYVITEEDNSDFAVQHFTLPEGAAPSEAFCVDLRYLNDDPTVAPERAQTLRIDLTNHTEWPWTLEARMECPYGLISDVPARIVVGPGETVGYTPTVKVDPNAYSRVPVDRVYPTFLSIKRLNCGDRWKVYRLPVTLLAPNRWTLNGTPTLVPAATVRFTEPAADGVYVAEATLSTPPVTRETRMICNCVWPITVELDGDVIIRTEELSPFMPAYHRVPYTQCRDGILQRGIHKVKVTVRMPEEQRDTLPFFVISLNAPAQVNEPGNFYAYVDDHFAE